MKLLFKGPYFPKHKDNRMDNEGDINSARKKYFKKKPTNLQYLLNNRYCWMNQYINGKEKVVELGSGAGFSREFINNPKLLLTDVNNTNVWIDQKVDALNMPFKSQSLDVIICSHMIHHIASPAFFFKEVERVLKSNGYLLIHDTHTSLFHRIILRVMRHEGWSYKVNVFDPDFISNDPEDPWSANVAIPELLFSNPSVFHSSFPHLKILKNQLCECLIFLISGGVTAKVKTINLPVFILSMINFIDQILIKILPSIFAFSRKVVIQKN